MNRNILSSDLEKIRSKRKKYKDAILTIDTIPSSSFGINARSMMDSNDWDLIRKIAYQDSNYKCSCCNASDTKLEAHEEWAYRANGHQVLINVIALCSDCHKTKHIGYSFATGGMQRVRFLLRRMGKINNWSVKKTAKYYKTCLEISETLSSYFWHVDISLIESKLAEYKERTGRIKF